MRIVQEVAGGQTTMQRSRNIEPVNGEAFFQAFQQRSRSLGIMVLEPTGDLAELGDAIFRVHLASRAHARAGLSLLLARQSSEHIAQFMISTPLHRRLGAEHRVNSRAQSFRAVDNEQSPSCRIKCRARPCVAADPWLPRRFPSRPRVAPAYVCGPPYRTPTAASTHCSPKCMTSRCK